jgi:hypothetical protein
MDMEDIVCVILLLVSRCVFCGCLEGVVVR